MDFITDNITRSLWECFPEAFSIEVDLETMSTRPGGPISSTFSACIKLPNRPTISRSAGSVEDLLMKVMAAGIKRDAPALGNSQVKRIPVRSFRLHLN